MLIFFLIYNMASKVLLSICIPAYNQPKALCEVLDSIVVDFEDPLVKNRVEIIIHDDASPSGSLAPVVFPYQEKYQNIYFARNKQNLGFDKNVLEVVSKAVGTFCWLMSDSDVFVRGAVKKVTTLLDGYPNIGYAYVQVRAYDDELKRELPSRPKSMEIVHITSAEEFILNYDLPGFLSSQIVRKELWDRVEKEKYIDNYWIHLSTILEFLPKTSMLYIGTPLIKAPNKNTWDKNGKSLMTFLSLHDIVNALEEYDYPKDFIHILNVRFARDLFGVMLYAKRRGLVFSIRTAVQLCYKFYRYPARLIPTLFIFMIPCVVLEYIAKLKHRIFK